ncbi:hypothetical protein EMCRGX_G023546 [Ephydatia muelleri]
MAESATAPYRGFSEEDLQKVLHDESCNSPEEGWSLASRSQFAEVWRKHCPNETVQLIKGFLHLPGVLPEDVVKMIHDLELRKRWDTQFPVIDVLEEHPTHRVVYWLVLMPPGVQSRDIVQYISEKRDESTNTTYILYNNAPEGIVPHKPGISCDHSVSHHHPSRSERSKLHQDDARAPGQWRDSMYNFYANVYSKEKNLSGEKEARRAENSLPTQEPADVKVLHEQLQTPEMATATRVTHEAKGTELSQASQQATDPQSSSQELKFSSASRKSHVTLKPPASSERTSTAVQIAYRPFSSH